MRIFLLIVCFPVTMFSQNTIGLPDIINYSKENYNAGLQNWDIRQDKNGIIYLANNEGLLSFDGRYWNLYPLPNKTIVRSVEIGADSRIYVGGQDEMGYFAPAKNGRLQFQSLTHLLPPGDRSFGDVWDILAINNEVFFRSPSRIFRYNGTSISAYKAPLEWAYLGVCNKKLYAYDHKERLMVFDNSAWSPLANMDELLANDPVTGMISLGVDSMMITTLKHGTFVYSSSGMRKNRSINSTLFENERIYAATAVTAEWIALATTNGGVYIIDAAENIIQSFSRTEGLQNNNVLSIFKDNQDNLWLGLDNGVDFIAYNSAIKHIIPLLQDESGYTVLIHDGLLYAGTSNGLYSVPLQKVNDLSFSKGTFTSVAGSKGQTWGLTTINNDVLLGHHEGAFVVSNNKVLQVSSEAGFWNFLPLSNSFPSRRILSGHYKGLSFFDYNEGKYVQSGNIAGFSESSRFVALDHAGNIWVSHPYHGVYKLTQQPDSGYAIKTYTDKDGLPSSLNNHIYKVKNEIVVGTEKGVYTYNERTDKFGPSVYYRDIIGAQSIRYLKEDHSGNIWFIHEKALGVIDLTGPKPSVIHFPELNNRMLSGFELIYSLDEQNVFLGGEKGFYHINYSKYKKKATLLNVQVRSVRIINRKDSLLFGGYFTDVNNPQVQGATIPEIDYNWKTIHFEFTSSLLGSQKNLEYCFRLKGFEQAWSEWTNRTEKEYTNLPPGNYSFEVKVRNNFGSESAVATFGFEVLPPWYLSNLAKIFYVLVFAGILYGLYRWQRKKFLLQQQKHEEEQQKLLYIHNLERSKTESELVELRNANLEAEINFKNSELASSAMHLVKKGELMANMKAELMQVMKRLDNEQAIGELKKMIRILGEDDNIDKEWENFAKHFDKVHSDFVVKLKEKYPAITGNELKLCAYLRMNLSTKEIAQLMNISVRGVEIGRYRLRKKLGIASNVNLFDYLINLE